MNITETQKVERDVVVDVICNMCEKSCTLGYGQEYTSCLGDWGYGSRRDGLMDHWHLCQDCTEDIVAKLKIPPTTNDNFL